MKKNEYERFVNPEEDADDFIKDDLLELWLEHDGELWCRIDSDLRWFNFYGHKINSGVELFESLGKIIGDK